jgi:hypothetical protein
MRTRLAARRIAYTLADVQPRGQRQLFFADPAGNGVALNFFCASPRDTAV